MVEVIGVIAGVGVGVACIVALFVILYRSNTARRKSNNHKNNTADPESENRADEEQATNPPAASTSTATPKKSKSFRQSLLSLGGLITSSPGEPDPNDEREERGGAAAAGGDQSSFSTIDYDYSKAYAGASGGNSVVSSVGGTQGGNTQEEEVQVDISRAEALGGATSNGTAPNSTANSLVGTGDSFKSENEAISQDDSIYVVQVPFGQKLGLVIHSAEEKDFNLPVVHTIKKDSVLLEQKVSVGDFLLRVDDIHVKGMTAMDVSKWIRTPTPSGTKVLTLMRQNRRPSLLSSIDQPTP